MRSFDLDLQALLTVAAATLEATGVLIEANAGFLRLLPADHGQPIGTKVGRCFIQPSFAALIAAVDADSRDGYRGIVSLGDYAGKTRTMRGHVWRKGSCINFLAEYDIVELERLSDAMLDMNQQLGIAQHALARANLALKQREGEIIETSLTDALTGVGNRRKLEQAIPAEIDRARRTGNPLSAIMTDVDHFKRVNDDYGHSAGDRVLVYVGKLLRSRTRSTDVVARFGGEEFVVLLLNSTLSQASLKAEQVRAALAAEIIPPLDRSVTASFGVAELMRDEPGESLLARADKALYQAKEAGRNRVVAAKVDSYT